MTRPSSIKTQRTVSRRTVVKGAAWAAPVVAMASAAPAFAASQNTSIQGYVQIGGNCSGLTINGTGSGYGLFIGNTTTSTTIANPYIIFFLSAPSLTWTTSSGNSGWTAPVYIGHSTSIGGRTMYGYKTDLTTPVTARAGTTTLPDLNFRTTSGNACPGGHTRLYALGERHVTINGEARSYDNGVTILDFGGRRSAPQSKSSSKAQSATTATTTTDDVADF